MSGYFMQSICRKHKFLIPALVVASAVFSGTVTAAPDNITMVAHRAVYDMNLIRSQNGGPESAKGRIVIEFAGSACEGYTQTIRQVFDIASTEGDSERVDFRSSTFEAGDASRFNFMRDNRKSSEKPEKVEGFVEKKSRSVLLNLTKPKGKPLSLPDNTLFPTEHMIALIKAAQAGEKRFATPLFDGTDDENRVLDTVAVIGPAKTDDDPVAAAKAFAGQPRWPMSLSFFERDKADGLPSQTMRFQVYANGVISSMVIDFGDFSIGGQLTALDLLKPSKCDK
jgi:hypothetical protein